MKRMTFWIIIGNIALASAAAQAASFDCAKARAVDERLICATPTLDAADLAVANAYRALIDAVTDEGARTSIRADQRSWIGRRFRWCGNDDGRELAAERRAYAVECLGTALMRRARLLTDMRANLPLGGLVRTVVSETTGPGRRITHHTEYPEIIDPAQPGAASFNDIIRRFVAEEIRTFDSDAIELPAEMAPSLSLVSEVFFPAPGVLSVQFRADGVLGNGFRYAAAVTVDLRRGRTLTQADIFSGNGWRNAAATACRKIAGTEPEFAETCAGPELTDLRAWRFETDRAVVTLEFPGKDLREISVPYRNLTASLKPGGPLGRMP